MAPRELIPLRLPEDPSAPVATPDGTDEEPSFEPIQRGPEITETR
jgi:hypothetical protein